MTTSDKSKTRDESEQPRADVNSEQPLTGVAGWFGRPVHLELRGPFELRLLKRSPLWRGEGVPAGGSKPLLIIPGFLAAPRSAVAVHHILSQAEWRAEVASVGRNSGPAYIGMDAAEADLYRLAREAGERVTIVGHSRGGQFARVLAVRHPDLVRQIVVIGTPLLVKYPDFAPVKLPIEMLDRGWRAGAFGEVFPERERAIDRDRWAEFPGGVDFVSIYSKTDGIVDWRSSIEPAATTMEISASHRGLLNSVPGVAAIADALRRQDTIA